MVASVSTVSAILTVIRKHVDKNTMLLILEDLKNVQGNESFRATVERLIKEANK